MKASDTWIVRVRMPERSVVRFQGMLGGEDGLATLRTRGGGQDEHELWSTWAQRDELDAWLDSLPAELELAEVDRYAWQAEGS